MTLALGSDAALTPLCPAGNRLIPSRAGLHRRIAAVFIEQFAPAIKACGVKRGCFDGRLHGAAGFVRVSAIAKAALGGKFGDLGKQAVDTGGEIGYMQRPHAGGINHPSAAGNGVQAARCCGVAALGIGFPNAAGRLWCVLIGADEGIEQSRFANAGGADEGNGMTGLAPWREGLDGVRRFGVQGYGDQAALQGLRLGDVICGIGDGIGLGQHDHRGDASLIHQGQVTLQPCRVKIGVAGGDDEQGIDIGGDQLWGVAAFNPAFQQGLGGQAAVQDLGCGICQHPITNGEIGGFGVDGQV